MYLRAVQSALTFTIPFVFHNALLRIVNHQTTSGMFLILRDVEVRGKDS